MSELCQNISWSILLQRKSRDEVDKLSPSLFAQALFDAEWNFDYNKLALRDGEVLLTTD